MRAFALAAVFAVLVAGAVTNFFMATRLAAVTPILLVCSGAFLDLVGRWVRGGTQAAAARLGLGARAARYASGAAALALFVSLTVFVLVGNVARANAMVLDEDVLDEYRNDQYPVAAYLAREAPAGGEVLVVTPGLRRDWSAGGVAEWVYARRRLRVRGSAELPGAAQLRAREMVVLSAENRSLADAEVRGIQDLADDAGACGTLRLEIGRTGEVVIASFVAGGVTAPAQRR